MVRVLLLLLLSSPARFPGFEVFQPTGPNFPVTQLERQVKEEWHSCVSGDESKNHPSFLSLSTSSSDRLNCECAKVRCNCVKRCDCSLPDEASSFLELQEALLEEGAPSSKLNSAVSLLEVEEPNQSLDCNCEKVKCDCLKTCECAVRNMLQGAGVSAAPKTDDTTEGFGYSS